jgi:small subunit ribosomal protein S25e
VVEGQGYAITIIITIHATVTISAEFPQETKEIVGRAGESAGVERRSFADIFCATVKDKANHAVVLDKNTAEKLQKDVQSYRLITVATLVDRLKINGSLARQALNDLEANGQIKKVVGHSSMSIYSALHYHPPSERHAIY